MKEPEVIYDYDITITAKLDYGDIAIKNSQMVHSFDRKTLNAARELVELRCKADLMAAKHNS